MSIRQIKLYYHFKKELNLSDDKAADFVVAVGDIGKDTEDQLDKIRRDIHSLAIKIEQSKGDFYKAMFFLTIIVQVLVILAGVLAIAKFMR
jgi:hypothetical protein